PIAPQSKGTWTDSAAHLPWLFDVTEALRDGDNHWQLSAPLYHGETLRGPVRLHASSPLQPVQVRRLSESGFSVRIGDALDHVLLENERGVVDWAHGRTDARCALLGHDGTVAATDVRHLRLPGGFSADSQSPCDFTW